MRKIKSMYSASFKAKIVIEALKEQETLSELAHKHNINPSLISQWKTTFLDNAQKVFEQPVKKDIVEKEKDQLFRQIGEMKVELDWLKKKLH